MFMNISTKYLGDIQIAEENIITFLSALPGLSDEHKFVLLNIPSEATDTFQVLQSVKTTELAFIVTNPYYFYQDYEFTLEDGIIEQLKIAEKEDVIVLAIVTLQEPFEESTINLKAPLIINYKENLGKQYILHTDMYKTRTPLSVSLSKEDEYMLILRRKINESIQIDDNIEVTVLAIEGEQIKLGIDAPKSVDIHRKEVYIAIQEENSKAASASIEMLDLLKDK